MKAATMIGVTVTIFCLVFSLRRLGCRSAGSSSTAQSLAAEH